MGYVLPFGQMSFWGATVITNLLSPFPCVIEWVSGGYYVYNPTLKRFFIFHFLLPFILCGFTILHIFYLHLLSSNNPLRNSTNNKIPFFPFIFQKDVFGFIIILTIYLLQTNFCNHKKEEGKEQSIRNQYFLGLRTSEIHLFYNLQLFYWHFLEILWLFIFLVFYKLLLFSGIILLSLSILFMILSVFNLYLWKNIHFS